MQSAYNSHVICMRQILRYALSNPARVVDGWHARLYFFSSGSLFKSIKPPLDEWILADKDRRSVCLTKLVDDEDDSEMFRILADCIFEFIKFKKQPFPSAMLSQEDFWNVPTWKRCIIFTFLYRFVMSKHVTKKYYEWTKEEFELTRSLFRRSVISP